MRLTALLRAASAPAVLAALLAGSAQAQDGAPSPAPSPSPAAPASPAPVRIRYKSNQLTFETDKVQINLQSRLQARWTNELPGADRQLAGTFHPGDSRGTFRVARARTKFDGWLYDERLDFELQLDWADPTSILRDVYLDYEVVRGGALRVKFGQFKVPFGRQELSSFTVQQFVDRSILIDEYEKGRDAGLQVWGTWHDALLEYRVGVFNGNGRPRTLATSVPTNDNGKYQYDARVQLQPWGDVKYSEVDFESKDRPLVAFGVEAEWNDTRVPPSAGGAATFNRHVLGVDATLKYRGVFLTAEYLDRTLTPVAGASFGSSGWHVQGGSFVLRRVLEVAARYASWDPSALVSQNDRTELGGAVNWYYNKHAAKIQGDVRRLRDRARPSADVEVRVQTQFLF